MEKYDIKKYIIVAILLILAYLAYLIVKPFITALLTSFVLAYLFYPIYKRIAKATNNKTLSATFTILLIVIITVFPLFYLSKTIIKESITLYNTGFVEKSLTTISSLFEKDTYIETIANKVIEKFVNYIKEQSAKFLLEIPSKIFHLLITVSTTFALFLVGEEFMNKTKKILPTKKKDELIKHIGNTTYSIVYGMFATAILEFIIALIVFKILGANLAVLLALTIGFLAFIPFLGPAIIWVPYAIIEMLRNNMTNAIILIILGITLFLIENLLKTKIISTHSKIHPIIVLLGTIGGVSVMGFIGLIVGPVLLSAIIVIIKDYYPEIKNEI